MNKKIDIDGVIYRRKDLPENVLRIVDAIEYLDKREIELGQLFASLRIAKHTIIDKLKVKLIENKAGVVL